MVIFRTWGHKRGPYIYSNHMEVLVEPADRDISKFQAYILDASHENFHDFGVTYTT